MGAILIPSLFQSQNGLGIRRYILQFIIRSISLTLFLLGNDLARALRWGSGYTGEKVMQVLRSVEDANLIKLDRQV